MRERRPNQSLGATAAAPFVFNGAGKFAAPWLRRRAVPGGCASVPRSLRHEVAFNTAWLDESPDQALRVAAGIPRKHASGGLWPSGGYCQGCGAFRAM